MLSMLLSAFNAVANLVFTAFKKVVWIIVITAVCASAVTAGMLVLGYNLAK